MKFSEAIINAIKKFESPAFIERIKEEDDTMLVHMDILKKINGFGYITNESQAGNKRSGAVGNTRFIISERAYITGFMLEEMAVMFIKNMAIYTDKNALFIPFCDNSSYIPSSLDIPLSITEKGGKISVDTHASSALPESVWNSYRKALHIDKKEPLVFILCWDSKWNRNASGASGLFTDIEKILVKQK